MEYASEILSRASNLVTGDREKQHGNKVDNHTNIARFWSAYLQCIKTNELSPENVAMMMALLKVARTTLGNHNPDDYIDGSAYVGIAGEIKSRKLDDKKNT